MDAVSFMYGFADELEKRGGKVTKAVGKAAVKGLKATGKAGKKVMGATWPYALMAGVPLYFGTKAIAEGVGRGVAEESNKRLPYER
jgi:hypothetical protein